ncbi:MAG: hypothetical protein FH753_09940 [Firmicutes bacterium]|nr:hypothetical protein [Bacillota bacterium]
MKKGSVILLSTIGGFILMSGGYGLWRDSLTIKGNITVIEEVYPEETMDALSFEQPNLDLENVTDIEDEKTVTEDVYSE